MTLRFPHNILWFGLGCKDCQRQISTAEMHAYQIGIETSMSNEFDNEKGYVDRSEAKCQPKPIIEEKSRDRHLGKV